MTQATTISVESLQQTSGRHMSAHLQVQQIEQQMMLSIIDKVIISMRKQFSSQDAEKPHHLECHRRSAAAPTNALQSSKRLRTWVLAIVDQPTGMLSKEIEATDTAVRHLHRHLSPSQTQRPVPHLHQIGSSSFLAVAQNEQDQSTARCIAAVQMAVCSTEFRAPFRKA